MSLAQPPRTFNILTEGTAPTLCEAHKTMLYEESGLSTEVVTERGYATVKRRGELPDFSPKQRRLGLSVPMYSPDGERTLRQIRPDKPRLDRRGKSIKYETPGGAQIIVDVHPSMLEEVRNGDKDLFITEGIKCGDAITSRGVPTIALAGVWMFAVRGSHGRELLPCFAHVKLEGRRVFVVYDSDVMVKPGVQSALERLVAALQDRGAEVRVVYLPDAEDGSKVGVDDFLASGKTVNELRMLAKKFDPAEIGQIRLSRDEKLRSRVDAALSRWRTYEWRRFFGTADHPNKTRGHSARDAMIVAIEEAAKCGKAVNEGVEFVLSVGWWALKAAMSKPTMLKTIRHLQAEGWIKKMDQGDRGTRYLLLVSKNLYRYGGKDEGEGKSGGENPQRGKGFFPRTPRLRNSGPTFARVGGELVRGYQKRLGKTASPVIEYLDLRGGSMAMDELAASMNASPRDLTSRKVNGRGSDGEVSRLEATGLLWLEDGTLYLTENWPEILEFERRLTGEIAAEERDRVRLRLNSRAYHNRHEPEPVEEVSEPEIPAAVHDVVNADDEWDESWEECIRLVVDQAPAFQKKPPDPKPEPQEPEISPLAAVIRDYLDRNPCHRTERPGWIAVTLWAYELVDGKPTPEQCRDAMAELRHGGRHEHGT